MRLGAAYTAEMNPARDQLKPQARDNLEDLLHCAAVSGRKDALRYLLEIGAKADDRAMAALRLPHRTHESNWFKSLLCNFGLHRWYRLNLGIAIPAGEVSLCRWCPKVKVRGALYGD